MHQHIKSGEIDHAPTEIFRQTFKEQLRDFLTASPDSLVLLVPSVRDILSDHPVFPQCELGSELSADAVSSDTFVLTQTSTWLYFSV